MRDSFVASLIRDKRSCMTVWESMDRVNFEDVTVLRFEWNNFGTERKKKNGNPFMLRTAQWKIILHC